jgi:hypothetical protein
MYEHDVGGEGTGSCPIYAIGAEYVPVLEISQSVKC